MKQENIKTNIHDLGVFSTPLHDDERGYFSENWRKQDLIEFGVPESFFEGKLQNNVSVSKKGVIRGIHFQGYPKLMTVAQGTFKMCFIDFRPLSSTYLQVDLVDVSPGLSVFTPSGVANGAQCISESGILNYLVADYYNPNKDYLGVTPLDSDLGIEWDKSSPIIVSAKDASARSYKQLLEIINTSKKVVGLIGSTGSVGSVVKDKLQTEWGIELHCFNRDNLSDISNYDFDVVICTAPSSEKLLTNLNLKNSEEEVESLVSAIQSVKTKHFILISTKSILESGNRYSEVHQKVATTVKDYHVGKFTIYIMDTLYGKTLNKGFISDLLSGQWSYLKDELVQKFPELVPYYSKLTDSLWKKEKDLPKYLLEKLPPISILYSESMYYNVTAISDLVEEVIHYLDKPKGILQGCKSSEILTGSEILRSFNLLDDSKLGTYFKQNKR